MGVGQFQVVYNSKKDAKNWFDATRRVNFCGKGWSDGLFGYYLDSFNRISKLSDKKAMEEARNLVAFLYDEKVIEKKKKLEEKLKSNFQEACVWIEKITGKKFSKEKTTIFLTTFPRAPYSPEENTMYFYVHWNDIVGIFLHEVLHMQIYRYWRTNPKSIVSKLSKDDFIFLNESMTFLLNEAPMNLVEKNDLGYPKHSEFRKELEKLRKEKKISFEELLEFGAENLKRFV